MKNILNKIFAAIVISTVLIPSNVAFAVAGSGIELPGVELPKVEIVEIDFSEVELPELELPTVEEITLDDREVENIVAASESTYTSCRLTANTYEVDFGGSIILTWETEGFDTIKVNGETVTNLNGSISIENITDNTSYTLEATNDNGDSCTTDVDITCNTPEVPRECKLSVKKVADKSVVEVGDTVTYTLKVTNIGNANCTGTGVWIEDILSSDHKFISYAMSDNVWAGYHPRPVYSAYSHRLSFNGQTLTPGEVAEIAIVTEILPRENLQCGADYQVVNKARASALELNEFNEWKWGSSKVAVDNSCPEVLGCMDVKAKNYNADANTSDYSCVYPVPGCMDAAATNYNADAEVNDNSCVYPISGCTDVEAKNYNADATVADNNSCIYPVLGCTDVKATNYDATADEDNESCVYPEPVYGCTDVIATNYSIEADTEDGSCVYPAPTATCKLYPSVTTITEGGSTELFWETTNAVRVVLSGEAGEVADMNGDITVSPAQTYMYELTAYNADGETVSCVTEIIVEEEEVEVIEGCTDAAALNYNANATVNNNSCEYPEVEEPVITPARSTSGGGGSISPRCEIEASAKIVAAGDAVTLTWETRAATEVILTDDAGTVLFTTEDYLRADKEQYLDYSLAVTPSADTTYTLTAERGRRDDECTVSVDVEEIVTLEVRDQAPLVAGIALSQVPHTGGGNVIVYYGFFALMILWAAAISIAFLTRGMKPATVAANQFTPNFAAMETAVAARPDLFPRY